MESIAIINGKISPLAEGSIPILDRGFLFGDAIFEVFVGFYDQVLDLDEHLARLEQSAEILHLELPWSLDFLRKEILTGAMSSKAPKKNIRLIVSRGTGLGLAPKKDLVANRYVIITPATIEAESIYRDGVSLKTKRKAASEGNPQAKTNNYQSSILALDELKRDTAASDIVWINAAGEFMEATTANIFFMGREGDSVEIATPPSNAGILAGITRQKIISLLRLAQIPVTERCIPAEELAHFDEAFLCSTVKGLVPIASIDKHRLHSGREKSVFRHIERLFKASVTRDLGYEVDWNTGKILSKEIVKGVVH